MAAMSHLNPFVLPTEAGVIERHGAVDLYLPEADEPRPAIVFVPGGPFPAAVRPTQREWPIYRGYASAAAARGVVSVLVEHRLHDMASYPLAAADVAAAVDLARADPRVDAERVALWFFSGSSLLLAGWLRKPPPWLRCAAATYPVLAPLPDWPVDPGFRPAEAVADGVAPPLVLTRVGRDEPAYAATVEPFVSAARAAGARLEIIDVPNGQHGFDFLDHTDESRAAVTRALDAVVAALA
jgi:acetyl esterase/lipase